MRADGTRLPVDDNCSAVTATEIETIYRGYVPDLTPGPMAGYVAVVMEPTGEMKPCVQVWACVSFDPRLLLAFTFAPLCVQARSPIDPPYVSFATQEMQACSGTYYQFSNWITRSDNCSSLFYNSYFRAAQLRVPAHAQQW